MLKVLPSSLEVKPGPCSQSPSKPGSSEQVPSTVNWEGLGLSSPMRAGSVNPAPRRALGSLSGLFPPGPADQFIHPCKQSSSLMPVPRPGASGTLWAQASPLLALGSSFALLSPWSSPPQISWKIPMLSIPSAANESFKKCSF